MYFICIYVYGFNVYIYAYSISLDICRPFVNRVSDSGFKYKGLQDINLSELCVLDEL